MDSKELSIQIALGTLVSEPVEIAKIVKKTDDPKVVKWGSNHISLKVRAAAAGNPALPLIDFIRLRLFETTKMVKGILDKK